MTADFTELNKVTGALIGMTETIQTDRFSVPIVENTHRTLGNSFDTWMDIQAEMNPQALQHVYEWGMTGPGARLWKHELKGRGSSNRFASWAWRASKTPIPTPQERHEDPNDPMSGIKKSKVDKYSDRRYVFIWKAPVMEYNKAVTIIPKDSPRLVYPVWTPGGGAELRFTDGSLVTRPGGDESTLAFTKTWVMWWDTVAPTIYKDTIENEIKIGIETATMAAVAKGSRGTGIGIQTMSEKAAISQGYRWAEANLHKFADRYKFNNGQDEGGD